MNRKALMAAPAALFVLLLTHGAKTGAQETTAPAPPSQPSTASPATVLLPPVQPLPGFAQTLFTNGNFLGVEAEEVTSENMSRYNLRGEPRGVGIAKVLKGSPAERAGLKENDVIVRFDGEAVTSVRKLNRLIDESSPAHSARLTVLRNGSEQEVSATLGKRENFTQAFGSLTAIAPAQVEELRRRTEELRGQSDEMRLQGELLGKRMAELGRSSPGTLNMYFGGGRRIGVSTTSLGKQLADYFGISQGRGALINSVEENSPADKAGLKAGDVIVEVDGQQVSDTGDVSRAINSKKEGDVTLTVVRDRKQRTFRVTPEGKAGTPLNLTPGTFVVPPVATLAPRTWSVPQAMTAPRALVAPRTLAPHTLAPRITPRTIAPRVITAPRVKGRSVL